MAWILFFVIYFATSKWASSKESDYEETRLLFNPPNLVQCDSMTSIPLKNFTFYIANFIIIVPSAVFQNWKFFQDLEYEVQNNL